MNMLSKIRRVNLRDGLSISEISRRTGLARNTIKSWLRAGEGAVPRFQRREAATIRTPCEERLRQWLDADARRAKPAEVRELLWGGIVPFVQKVAVISRRAACSMALLLPAFRTSSDIATA